MLHENLLTTFSTMDSFEYVETFKVDIFLHYGLLFCMVIPNWHMLKIRNFQ